MIRRYGTQSVMKVRLNQPIMREVLGKFWGNLIPPIGGEKDNLIPPMLLAGLISTASKSTKKRTNLGGYETRDGSHQPVRIWWA